MTSHWHAYLWQHISLCRQLPAPSSWLITNRLSLSLTKILATSKLQHPWIFERRLFDISNKSRLQTGTGASNHGSEGSRGKGLMGSGCSWKLKLWWTQSYCWYLNGLWEYLRKHNNTCDEHITSMSRCKKEKLPLVTEVRAIHFFIIPTLPTRLTHIF